MLALVLQVLLSTSAFPSNSSTSWMRPESFHLSIGMARDEALKTLDEGGFHPEKGDDASHLLVDYTPTQSMTLEFGANRLRSIRFELYLPAEHLDGAFDDEKHFLKKSFGEPKPVKSPAMLVYDSTLPNVMVVRVRKPTTHGSLSTLVVRYYDPVSK